VTGLFRKEELDQEIEEELQFHLAMRTQEKIARGMDPAEADAEARRQLGNINLVKDSWRDVTGGGALEVLWQDVRFACRMLLKDRGFTAVAVVALALGIGANTALFTVMSSVLLRPLPYPHSERLMAVWSQDSEKPGSHLRVSYPDFADFASQNRSFERLGAFVSGNVIVEGIADTALNLRGASVHPDTFALLGVKPVIGRTFRRSENEPGQRVAIISHRMWQEHFGGAANITKSNLVLDGETHRIIGVMPAGFPVPDQQRARADLDHLCEPP